MILKNLQNVRILEGLPIFKSLPYLLVMKIFVFFNFEKYYVVWKSLLNFYDSLHTEVREALI